MMSIYLVGQELVHLEQINCSQLVDNLFPYQNIQLPLNCSSIKSSFTIFLPMCCFVIHIVPLIPNMTNVSYIDKICI